MSEQVVDKGHGISCNSCGLWLGVAPLCPNSEVI